jgi:hypothetical protein
MRAHSRADEYEQLQVVNIQPTIHRAVGYDHCMIDCKRYNAFDRALYLNAWCPRVFDWSSASSHNCSLFLKDKSKV